MSFHGCFWQEYFYECQLKAEGTIILGSVVTKGLLFHEIMGQAIENSVELSHGDYFYSLVGGYFAQPDLSIVEVFDCL